MLLVACVADSGCDTSWGHDRGVSILNNEKRAWSWRANGQDRAAGGSAPGRSGKGSVLLCLRWTVTTFGSDLESTDMSATVREKSALLLTELVNSLACIKPKKPRQHAAHSILLLKVHGSLEQEPREWMELLAVFDDAGEPVLNGEHL